MHVMCLATFMTKHFPNFWRIMQILERLSSFGKKDEWAVGKNKGSNFFKSKYFNKIEKLFIKQVLILIILRLVI